MMKFDKAYFISWKPTRDRLDILDEAVAWAKSKDLHVCIVAMEWLDSDYSRYDVDYMKIPYQLPPGQARNLALNHFYSTEDDYCIILDDDTFIEVGDDIIDVMRRTDYPDVNVVSVLEHCHMHRYEESDDHIFRIPGIFASGCFIVKNQRVLFFNPMFKWNDGKLQYGEDVDFLCQAWYHDLGGWEVTTAVSNQSRDRSNTPSTWYYEPSGKSEHALTSLIKKKITPPENKHELVVEMGARIESCLGEVKPFRVKR